MTTEAKATHTPGAIRAAEILWDNIFQKARAVDDPARKRAWVSMTAELIDRETAAPDLLAVLGRIRPVLRWTVTQFIRCRPKLRAHAIAADKAIAKAKGDDHATTT